MDLAFILAALRRNKGGAALIVGQVAVTLAILCNALFIIHERWALSLRGSGADEADIFVIDNQWVGKPTDLQSRATTDVSALRALSGVVDAYVTNSYPLENNGWWSYVDLHPQQVAPTATAALYFGDTHALGTLGLTLVGGRNFDAAEVLDRQNDEMPPVAGIIITRALAAKLFPVTGALGQVVVLDPGAVSAPVIGIVDKLQVPWTGGFGSAFNDNSIVLPHRYIARSSFYVVRAKPGHLAGVMAAAQRTLFDINRARLIQSTRSLGEARSDAYRVDRGVAMFLAIVCVVLLTVTVCGVVGLTSYWVTQRRRQIGIRRALGATRVQILGYFQTENFVIAGAGTALGVVLAVAGNLWMVSSFELSRLEVSYIAAGAASMLVLGQIATFWPAMRAASIPPALAARST
jgi:putative ABC transport system permease protein